MVSENTVAKSVATKEVTVKMFIVVSVSIM